MVVVEPVRRLVLAVLVAIGGGITAVGVAPSAGAVGAVAPGGSVQWSGEGRSVLGRPAIFRGSTGGVEVAWLDSNLVTTVFVAGTGDPGGPWPGGGQVAPEVRSRLVAAFNGGFKLGDLPGGWYTDGRVNKALVPGQASVVVYRDGHLDVGEWGRQVELTPDVVSVRQNLGLLVDDGRPTPAATRASARPAGLTRAWARITPPRASTPIAERAVAIPATDPPQLVEAAAGAVRGMQLDINPTWTALVVYDAAADGSVSGRRVMGTGGPAGLYLSPYARDFFAVLIRPTVAPGGTGTIGQPAVSVELAAPKR